MKKNKLIIKFVFAACLLIVVLLCSAFIVGPVLAAVLNYNTVEASEHVRTHALLISLIFTVILCTIFILEKIKKIEDKLK